MRVKLFILGHPGSGKSHASRHIQELVDQKGWKASRFNDYHILRNMYLAEAKTKWERFRPAAPEGGFDVIKKDAFDDALKELAKGVLNYLVNESGNTFCIIEFAREDYNGALRTFQSEFWQDAYILFLDIDRKTGIERIAARVANPKTEDDHPLSEYAWREYYSKRIGPDATYLKALGFSKEVTRIDNRGSLQEFIYQLERYVQALLERTSPDRS